MLSVKIGSTVEAVAMADPGSCANLMPPAVLEQLENRPNCVVQKLSNPIVYNMAVDAELANGKRAVVVCRRTVVCDVELRIRHGSTLTLRNVRWVIPDQHAEHVLLGRQLLEALGLNTKEVLQAACDKHHGIVNMDDILQDQEPKVGTLAKLLDDRGLFHSDGGEEDYDGADEDDIYIDL